MQLALPAILTQTQARACAQALCARIQSLDGAAVSLDASALQRFDTAALAVLLASRRAAQARGLAWSVQHLPPKLGDLAALYGVRELLAASS